MAARKQMQVAFAPAGVFNSLEFSTNATSGISNWRNAITRIATERATYESCDHGSTQCPAHLRIWRDHLKSWAGLSVKARLIQVNRWANAAVRYTDDRATFQTTDYWASPAQSLKGRGDCEDYALLKYESLRALGFAEDALRIVVVNDLRRGIGHAVLSVKTDMGTFILDNQDDRVMRHDGITRYAPLFSINAKGRWINIATRSLKRAKPAITLVASADELDNINTAAASLPAAPPQRLSATAAISMAAENLVQNILRPAIWG